MASLTEEVATRYTSRLSRTIPNSDLFQQPAKRNRYYDPQTGRFTQEDPIGLAGGVNAYGFAGGDPINYSDPFGLCDKDQPCPIMQKTSEWAEAHAKESKGKLAVKAYTALDKISKVIDAFTIGKAIKDTEDHVKVANRMVKRMDELGSDLEKNTQAIQDDM